MIIIHDRNEIPVGFSNDNNDRYCIISSFAYRDSIECYFAFPHMNNYHAGYYRWGFRWVGFYSKHQDKPMITWMQSNHCDISKFITDTFIECDPYHSVTIYVLESPGDVEKFIADHNIMNSDFVQEMRSKWIYERSIIDVRHKFNV